MLKAHSPVPANADYPASAHAKRVKCGVQLVTPDVSGGVTDFTYTLGEALGEDCEVFRLSEENAAEWDTRGKAVVIQFSGYGYQKRGTPLWLLKAVRSRRSEIPSLGIFFHELFAPVTPPWRSSFYLAPVQRFICRELANLADFWMTNREHSAAWLREKGARTSGCVLPTFSSMGEAQRPLRERARTVAVFGGALLRQSAYSSGAGILQWAREHGYVVQDIGPTIQHEQIQVMLREFGVVQLGRLGAAEVGAVLDRAQFGLLTYPLDYIAKSSVLGAYCAHAVCPIVIAPPTPASDGFMPGQTFLHANDLIGSRELNPEMAARRIGEAAWAWYQPHRVEAHARQVAESITQTAG
jgi:hypothetical protein